jgi:DNA-binding NarL/FixJ family response regulator
VSSGVVAGYVHIRSTARSTRRQTLVTRRPRRTGPEALSPSERRVARLANEGHSNRAIAQSLFVTTKTVEVHLSSCYRKLGISSRSDLAAFLR